MIETIVLSSKEVTTAKLTELFNKGFKIISTVRQEDGTDSLVLTNTTVARRGNRALKFQASQYVDPAARAMGDAELVIQNIEAANKGAVAQKDAMTKSYKKVSKGKK